MSNEKDRQRSRTSAKVDPENAVLSSNCRCRIFPSKGKIKNIQEIPVWHTETNCNFPSPKQLFRGTTFPPVSTKRLLHQYKDSSSRPEVAEATAELDAFNILPTSSMGEIGRGSSQSTVLQDRTKPTTQSQTRPSGRRHRNSKIIGL